jgi:glycosyltransferase involved in cell wall biosynthesis
VKAIFVSQFEPLAVGHGGNHRALQIQYDLKQVVGPDNVLVASYAKWRRSQATAPSAPPWLIVRAAARILCAVQRLRRRAARLLPDDAVALAVRKFAPGRRYAAPGFRRHYESLLADINGPAICVIEHFEFADLIEINRQRGIPTAICTQNIETFDGAIPLAISQPRRIYSTSLDFADELLAIGKCDARLFISRVETAVIGGLGFESVYYPYLPVAEIRQRLDNIRRDRRAAPASEPFFLMLGSASHRTTRASFEWFIHNARVHGLPGGIRVIVVGAKTDQLDGANEQIEGLEFRGWVDQDELDRLLVRATAVLIPQLLGFGALTRLAEMACAGIPAIASAHCTLAIDRLPGLMPVENDWNAWCRQIERLAKQRRDPTAEEYEEWERRQPAALREHARRLIDAAQPPTPLEAPKPMALESVRPR